MSVNEFKYLNKVYDRIRSAKAVLHESLSLSTLQVDTLTVVVVSEETPSIIIPPEPPSETFNLGPICSGGISIVNGFPRVCKLEDREYNPNPLPRPVTPYNFENYTYGTECFYYHSGSLFGKFYISKIEQVDRIDWKFSCISAIGLLLNTYHYGGVYQGAPAKDVITEVIGGLVPFTCDASLNRVKVYGWLPKATRRDNLKRVLFAANAYVTKDSNGDMVFKAFSENDTTPLKVVDIDKYYMTGNSVTKGSPATQAQVTEHSYFASSGDTVVKAFSGEAKGDTFVSPQGVTRTGCLVDFQQPLHDLVASGCTILESGVNYAIITESANAVLTGKAYTHTERTLINTKPGITSKPNVVSCTNCHLVSVANSELVGKRLMAYYGEARKVTCDLVATAGERPGDRVQFKDPWSKEPLIGYIQSMDITFSKEIKAKTTMITGYYPPAQEEEQDFTHRVVLTGSGSWTVPTTIPGTTAKVKKIRYALFSGATGGSGGQGGQSGPKSTNTKSWTHTSWITGNVTDKSFRVFCSEAGGAGGSGGPGGKGSRVLQGTLDVSPGQTLNYNCGAGGPGGSGGSGGASSNPHTSGSNGSSGSEGGATTLGSLSSANGTFPASTGWVDVITGEIYCQPGGSGKPGGKGAGEVNTTASEPYKFSQFTFTPSTAAVDQNGVSWAGQATRSGTTIGGSEVNGGTIQDVNWSAANTTAGASSYGLGAGGVAGRNQGTCNAKGPQSTTRATACAGQTPVAPVEAPETTTPTKGGYGGYGGGGASAPGMAGRDTDPNGKPNQGVYHGSTGAGGPGGKGGKAGPGMIIIYY